MNSIEDRANHLGSRNTILAYCLENDQIALLRNIVKGKTVKGYNLIVHDTNVFTDLYAIPHFIAFINFEGVSEEDQENYWSYWRECTEPLPDDLDEEIYAELKDLVQPLTYIFNCRAADIKNDSRLFLNTDILNHQSQLRLTILQEMKNKQGRGTANENSERIRRVLYMYHLLVYRGWITKQELDHKWVEVNGYDEVSDRTFKRDMRIIKEMNPYVRYNRQNKRYEVQYPSI
jgi:hypothetical protein